MEQEFVTLPREVVELAIETLLCTDSEEGSTAFEDELKAVKKLRAALEQPKSDQPAMTPIAQRKLDSLLAEGYSISGYSIYHEQKHQHGFVTGAGLVGWWKPEGMEYPQPLGEQEPVAFIRNRIGEDFSIRLNRVVTAEDFAGDTENFLVWCRGNADHGWRPLYTRPQPKRPPLTDEEIDKLDWGPRPDEPMTFKDGLRDFARAIEAAHNIK